MVDVQYKGVNLGGWLILEKWMTPSLFEGLAASDEYGFCTERGNEAQARLKTHRDTFITSADLEWIAAHGLNAVRLPVPYWCIDAEPPYHDCIVYVDWLMEEAPRYGLSVLLDLHAAPGSQNGWDHSGRVGTVGWTDNQNMQKTRNMLSFLADRYAHADALIGIELLNEPHPTMDQKLLTRFYEDAYDVLHAQYPDLLIIMSDAFRPKKWGKTFLSRVDNVALDMHLYQAFDAADKKLDIHKHIKKAKYEWADLIADVQGKIPAIIGEWSLGLDNKTFRGMDDFARDKAMQAYAQAQLSSFGQSLGWFFWSYKTENMAGWSYRDAVARGWLPSLV